MANSYLRELNDNDYIELDNLLSEFYGYLKDEMIDKNDFTKFSVEMAAMRYLGTLFGSLKSFDKITRKVTDDSSIKVEVKNSMKFNDKHQEEVFDVLMRYFVFIIKCFKSVKVVSKERALNLAVAWLKDYLRITAYRVTYIG